MRPICVRTDGGEPMSEEEKAKKSRRDFLKNAGTVAVTAPATAMLLSASLKAGADSAHCRLPSAGDK